MGEFQSLGMQAESVMTCAAIGLISENRDSELSRMKAYLVGFTRPGPGLEHEIPSVLSYPFNHGMRFLRRFTALEAEKLASFLADEGANFDRTGIEITVAEKRIGFPHEASGELFGQ